MTPAIRTAFEHERSRSVACERARDLAGAWRALERSHILAQRWAWPHLRSHAAMLALALRSRDPREMAGQVLRLVLAAPGSLLGRAPLGNTGRSDVGAFTPMEIPEDLAAILAQEGDPQREARIDEGVASRSAGRREREGRRRGRRRPHPGPAAHPPSSAPARSRLPGSSLRFRSQE